MNYKNLVLILFFIASFIPFFSLSMQPPCKKPRLSPSHDSCDEQTHAHTYEHTQQLAPEIGSNRGAAEHTLLLRGADQRQRDSDGKTLLAKAVADPETNSDVIKLLLNHEPDLSFHDHGGNNLLHMYCGIPRRSFAAQFIDADILELLAKKIDVNAPTQDGGKQTPLHKAAYCFTDDYKLIGCLLDLCADPNKLDALGNTVLDIFLRNRTNRLHSMHLEEKNAIALLLVHGAETKYTGTEYNTTQFFEPDKLADIEKKRAQKKSELLIRQELMMHAPFSAPLAGIISEYSCTCGYSEEEQKDEKKETVSQNPFSFCVIS